MPASQKFWSVWRAPLVLLSLTVAGLLAALLGDQGWHWASWLALAAPLAVIALYVVRPRVLRAHSSGT